jgi:hypothetical protein
MLLKVLYNFPVSTIIQHFFFQLVVKSFPFSFFILLYIYLYIIKILQEYFLWITGISNSQNIWV